MGRPYIGANEIGGTPPRLDTLSKGITARALHTIANPGFEYLTAHHPDIASQLEKLSHEWTLIPKAAVAGQMHIKYAASNLREYVQYNVVPESITLGPMAEKFHAACLELADYLENTVYPSMENYAPPYTMQRVEEAFRDDLTGEDESEDGGDDSGEYGEGEDSERDSPS